MKLLNRCCFQLSSFFVVCIFYDKVYFLSQSPVLQRSDWQILWEWHCCYITLHYITIVSRQPTNNLRNKRLEGVKSQSLPTVSVLNGISSRLMSFIYLFISYLPEVSSWQSLRKRTYIQASIYFSNSDVSLMTFYYSPVHVIL